MCHGQLDLKPRKSKAAKSLNNELEHILKRNILSSIDESLKRPKQRAFVKINKTPNEQLAVKDLSDSSLINEFSEAEEENTQKTGKVDQNTLKQLSYSNMPNSKDTEKENNSNRSQSLNPSINSKFLKKDTTLMTQAHENLSKSISSHQETIDSSINCKKQHRKQSKSNREPLEDSYCAKVNNPTGLDISGKVYLEDSKQQDLENENEITQAATVSENISMSRDPKYFCKKLNTTKSSVRIARVSNKPSKNLNSQYLGILQEEPRSSFCEQCEEIYRYCIFHNVPLKPIQCVYCKNQLNSCTLDFLSVIYKEELKQKYRKEIEEQLYESEHNNFSFSHQKATTEQFSICNTEIPKHTNQSEIRLDTSKNCELMYFPNYTGANAVSNNEASEEGNESEEDDESEELMDNNGPISLAEAFRRKKLKLLKKLEARKKKAEMKTKDKFENYMVLKQQKKKKPPKQKKAQSNQKIKKVKEPPKELLDRLISGKHAPMSKREIKELNARMVNRLPEVRAKNQESSLNNNFDARNRKLKSYSQNIKQKIISK